MTAFARRSPASLALWLAPLASATVFSSVAFAQSSSSRAQPYADPYRSGSTRPLDGSPRSGVYSTKPAPSYETTRRGVGAPVGPRELPAIWSGLYVGVQGGYRWSNTEVTGVPAISTKGFQGGGHIGYNFQTSSNLVLGLETDLMLGGATSSSTNGATTATMRDTWNSSVRARAGYAFGPALLYGTGGIAIAGQDLTLSNGAASANFSDMRLGYVVGAGVEYKFTPQISGRIEGLHYGYRDSSVSWAAGSQVVKQDSNVLRGGLSFQFN